MAIKEKFESQKEFNDKIASLYKRYEALKIIVNMKSLHGIQFLKVCIQKIEVARKIFLEEI